MGKPLSWKWKLTLAVLGAMLFGMAFVFTPSGQAWMLARIDTAFEEMPESERRDSDLADSYMTLAWWRSNVMLDGDGGNLLYKEFCGINKDPKTGYTVFESGKLVSKYCSPDGRTGWGPMHPRAPEAFYAYLENLQSTKSSQAHITECFKYNLLFYGWMIRYSPEHKPHPLFNKYWPKIKNMIAVRATVPAAGVDMQAPMAEPWVDPNAAEAKKE